MFSSLTPTHTCKLCFALLLNAKAFSVCEHGLRGRGMASIRMII